MSVILKNDPEQDVKHLISVTREKLHKSIEMGFEEVAI